MSRSTFATFALCTFLAGSAYAQGSLPPPPAPPPPPPAAPGAAPAPAAPAAAPGAAPTTPGRPGLSETLSGDAKADYESGKVLFSDGDNAGALVKFRAAYDKSKDARLLWNMAACEKNLRHYAKTLKLVRQYLAEGLEKLGNEDLTEARELIRVIEPFTAKVRVNVSEPGAEVYLDDELVGKSPLEALVVDMGQRRIKVKLAEFEEFAREIPVSGGADVVVDAGLVRVVHEGRLSVRTKDGARIEVDGKLVGTGSWTGVLPSGGHALRITADKMLTHQQEVYIRDKESREVNITLQEEPSRGLPAWAWITGGVVVAGGLGVAGVLLFKPKDTYDGPKGNLGEGIAQASVPLFRR